MFCNKCGAQQPDTARFCNNCGAPLVAPQQPVQQPEQPLYQPVQQPEQPMYQPVQQPEQPMYQPVQPQQPKKKKGKALWITLIAVVAAVAIFIGCFYGISHGTEKRAYEEAIALMEDGKYEEALDILEDIDYEDSARQARTCRRMLAQAAAATEPTEVAETTEATEPVEPVDITVTEAELVYELTEADVDKFYELLAAGEELALTSTDADAVDAAIDELDVQYEYLESQYSIAMVLYYCDLNNEDASALYLEATDIVMQANNDYLEMARRLYLSDSPHKDMLFEDWTEKELQMLVLYTDEVMRLEKRNKEIEVAYQDMQDSDTMYTDMVPLYMEMVRNNNRIAQIYGYNNYYEYAYDMVYERDYDPSKIEVMRNYVATYLPDAMEGAYNRVVSGIQGLNSSQYGLMTALIWDHYEASSNYITGYLGTLPANARNNMSDMFHGNILLKHEATGAMEGAFTTSITEDRSLCYFGPGYSNALTILHEAGHYYGSKFTFLNDIPMDLAETQSQGNEWLFVSYLLSTDSKAVAECVRDYQMYSNMTTIIICVIVDEFEQRVYTHPNAGNLTSAELDAIMEDVCKRYGGMEFLGEYATDIQQYWRMVVVEQPVYYISYAVSALAALDIYNVARTDYAKGVEIYCSLVENVDLDAGFLANIQNAGISGPFEEDIYIAIAEMFR